MLKDSGFLWLENLGKLFQIMPSSREKIRTDSPGQQNGSKDWMERKIPMGEGKGVLDRSGEQSHCGQTGTLASHVLPHLQRGSWTPSIVIRRVIPGDLHLLQLSRLGLHTETTPGSQPHIHQYCVAPSKQSSWGIN